MRDLIEKLCNMGYAVEFSEEQGYPVIRIFKETTAAPRSKAAASARNVPQRRGGNAPGDASQTRTQVSAGAAFSNRNRY